MVENLIGITHSPEIWLMQYDIGIINYATP